MSEKAGLRFLQGRPDAVFADGPELVRRTGKEDHLFASVLQPLARGGPVLVGKDRRAVHDIGLFLVGRGKGYPAPPQPLSDSLENGFVQPPSSPDGPGHRLGGHVVAGRSQTAADHHEVRPLQGLLETPPEVILPVTHDRLVQDLPSQLLEARAEIK